MITNLHVKNLALIDEADVSFRPGLNILTGETGAGKSILLGSINLALGQKMDSGMIRSGADHALVELVFEIESEAVLKKLRALDVEPEDGVLVLSRKVQEGRSVCRLNGETCSASRLREISSLLLDVHGQHEHQSLLYADRQLEILDAYGRDTIGPLLLHTNDAYACWREAMGALAKYQTDESTRERESALLEHEVREIEDASLIPGEDETLESEYRRMNAARRIAEALQCAHRATDGSEGAGDAIGRAVRELSGIREYGEDLEALSDSLIQIENLLGDFNRELAACEDGLSFSEEEFYRTQQRLDQLNTIKSRYGRTIEDVLAALEAKKEALEELAQFSERRAAAKKAAEEARAVLEAAAGELTEERKKRAAELAEKIRQELLDLNFLSVGFEIAFSGNTDIRANGADEVSFMISTNPGEPLRPLAKIASGGELSRIMLAIKTLLADKDETETLLFDEIDTGVSGRTAQKVAEKMARIGRSHQVLCITHLAQLAAMADHHFGIFKDADTGVTETHIRELTGSEAEEELARILGGALVTEAVRNNAKEMRLLAQREKADLYP